MLINREKTGYISLEVSISPISYLIVKTLNGPENISKYLRVPVPDQPALGILRLSPIKARELNLAPDQIIRGVVSEDGDFVEISTSNVQQQIRAQLEQWKGRVVELKVDLDQSGSRSSRASIKLEENSSVSKPIESPKILVFTPSG